MTQPVFTLSEGTLTLPQAGQDNSITILKFEDAGASLVITRAWDVKPGDEENYLNQQLAKIKRTMKRVVLGEIQPTQVAGLAAREVALSFDNQAARVNERIAVFRHQDHLMVMTFTRITPFDASADAFWVAIKDGFQPGA